MTRSFLQCRKKLVISWTEPPVDKENALLRRRMSYPGIHATGFQPLCKNAVPTANRYNERGISSIENRAERPWDDRCHSNTDTAIEHKLPAVRQEIDSRPSRSTDAITNDAGCERFDAARRKLERRLRWNRLSMRTGFFLGAAALAAAFCAPQTTMRWLFLLGATTEFVLVPCCCVLESRRLRRILVLIRQESEVDCSLLNGSQKLGSPTIHSPVTENQVCERTRAAGH